MLHSHLEAAARKHTLARVCALALLSVHVARAANATNATNTTCVGPRLPSELRHRAWHEDGPSGYSAKDGAHLFTVNQTAVTDFLQVGLLKIFDINEKEGKLTVVIELPEDVEVRPRGVEVLGHLALALVLRLPGVWSFTPALRRSDTLSALATS